VFSVFTLSLKIPSDQRKSYHREELVSQHLIPFIPIPSEQPCRTAADSLLSISWPNMAIRLLLVAAATFEPQPGSPATLTACVDREHLPRQPRSAICRQK
jgi:hypothetical protein